MHAVPEAETMTERKFPVDGPEAPAPAGASRGGAAAAAQAPGAAAAGSGAAEAAASGTGRARWRTPDGCASDAPDFIAENLRRMFGAVENEALPDRFTQLLDRLAQQDRGE